MTARLSGPKVTPEERAQHIRALMEKYATEMAEQAPSLTPDQLGRLAALLNTPGE